MEQITCREFVEELSSASPVPGGGGASAYVGAMGLALGAMVANLTIGKKRYEEVQEDIKVLLDKSHGLINDMLYLIKDDEENFKPLAKAYSLPKKTQEEKEYKAEVMEDALYTACLAPVKIMRRAVEGLEIQKELVEKGAAIALSDVGTGTEFLRACLLGASLNVYINAKLIKNREKANELVCETDRLSIVGTELADTIFKSVRRSIR